MTTILAAILYLAPHLSKDEAAFYAILVRNEARRSSIPALLIVAIVQRESGWNNNASSATADHGLAQVHVSASTYPEFIGHEYLLYDPVINLHLAVKLMRFWRDWHYANCYPFHHHPWFSHLKWGYKVKDNGKSARRRVGRTYRLLLKKFNGDTS